MEAPQSSTLGISCPACGDSASIKSHGKRYAVYPAGCLLLGGILLPLLHQASGPVDYECGKCGKKFGVRSTRAKIALILLVFSLVLILIGIIAALRH